MIAKKHKIISYGGLFKTANQRMRKRFADVMITYHKRNGAFIYDPSQAEIMVRLLEVVFNRQTAFWLYCLLVETILPLGFYSNRLFPQTLSRYTLELVKHFDSKLYA